jgi:hypothetical protein
MSCDVMVLRQYLLWQIVDFFGYIYIYIYIIIYLKFPKRTTSSLITWWCGISHVFYNLSYFTTMGEMIRNSFKVTLKMTRKITIVEYHQS